jgi:hypothetical protein
MSGDALRRRAAAQRIHSCAIFIAHESSNFPRFRRFLLHEFGMRSGATVPSSNDRRFFHSRNVAI